MSNPHAGRGVAVPSPRARVATRLDAAPIETTPIETAPVHTPPVHAAPIDPVPPRCTHPSHEDMGVYVLGALRGTEERRFEAHLATCATCTAELEDLLSVRMLLDSVDPAIAVPDAIGTD